MSVVKLGQFNDPLLDRQIEELVEYVRSNNEELDLAVAEPSAISTLTATGGWGSILLEFSYTSYNGHLYTEVWRSDDNVFANGERVGATAAKFYNDTLSGAALTDVYYYWVRNVNVDGDASDWYGSASGSISTSTSFGVDDLLGQLGFEHFASGTWPIRSEATLPDLSTTPSTYPVDTIIYLTTNGLLYKNVNWVWEPVVSTTDMIGQITTTQIADDAITTPKILAGQVTADQLASNSVIAGKIQAGALVVDDGVMQNGYIKNALINDAAITNAKLDRASANKIVIVEADIDSAAITTAKIDDAAITNAKLDRASANKIVIGEADIADAAITTAKIDDLAVDTAQIADGAIENAKIGNAQVDTLQLAGECLIVPVSYTNAATTTLSNVSTEYTIADSGTFTVDNAGQKILVQLSTYGSAYHEAAATKYTYYKFYGGASGTTLSSTVTAWGGSGSFSFLGFVPMMVSVTSVAGNNRIIVKAYHSGHDSCSISKRQMLVQAVQK